MRTNFILDSVLSGLRRNVTMTIALVLNTAITLAFVGAALLANKEISQFKQDYESRLSVSVFVCSADDSPAKCPPHTVTQNGKTSTTKAASAAQIAALKVRLEADPAVSSVSLVTERQQYDRAKRTLPSLTKPLQLGEIPASYTVKLKDIGKDYKAFYKRASAFPAVGEIQNQDKVIKALQDVINGFLLFSVLVALVVLIASILLIANTIQVAAQQRRNETSIMRLVGASRWMTELPFLLEAVIAAIVGGVIACGMLFAGKYFVLNNVFKVQVENGVIPNLSSNDVLVACGTGLIGGIVVSGLTAFLTLRLYVKL